MSQTGQTWHFARSAIQGEEKKNKAPLTSPLFWPFHSRPQKLIDGSDVKRTNQKMSHYSKNRKITLQITLQGYESPLNVRLSAAKIRFSSIFAQSKFRMSKRSGEKEKRENLLLKEIL